MRKAATSLALFMSIVLIHSAVFGSTISEIPGNDTLATAQNIDGFFSLDFNPNIGDTVMNTSTVIPHVTIEATGDGTFDYFSFTVPAAGIRGIFDIDNTSTTNIDTPFDAELFIFEPDGTFHATNDNANALTDGALGSSTLLDPYLEYVFPTSGTFIVAVGRFNSIPLGPPNAGLGGTMVKDGDRYDLHVSIPEPASWVLLTIGGLAATFIRRKPRVS